MWWQWIVSGLAGLGLLWLFLLTALWLAKPEDQPLRESLRLLPDVVRLLNRLAHDRTVPLRVRLQLWGLLAYLMMPIDIIPDFIPVLGYADDAIIVILVLRSVVRHGSRAKLAEHWPGTTEGLAAVGRLARIPPADS